MIELNGKVKLSKSEFVELQTKSAKNGFAVNHVNNMDQYDNALFYACQNHPVFQDFLQYLETGTSPMFENASFDEPQAAPEHV